ncbi:MAG TPA: DUF3999 domain-containing protein [Acidiferrobacterales bacterium]
MVGTMLTALTAGAAHADAPPRPDDFAYGRALHFAPGGAIYRLALPDDVYRHATRDDLGDLRVFNAAGEAVPHALRAPAGAEDPVPAAESLPFFELRGAAAGRAESLSLSITTDPRGAIIGVRNTDAPDAPAVVQAYVLDASRLERLLRELSLHWAGARDGFVAQLNVDASDDLNRWQRWVTNAGIAELRQAGHTLTRHTLELGDRQAKYLRLSWPLGARGVTLTAAAARPAPARREPPRRWLTLDATGVEHNGGVLHYDTRGRYPVDRIDLALPEPNSVIQAMLYSRAGEQDDWRRRGQGIFYRLDAQGTALQHRVLSIAGVTDRYWQLRIAGDGAGDAQPQLKLGWPAGELHFVARGEPPFTLAYGGAGVAAAAQPVDGLLRGLERHEAEAAVAPAEAAARRVLGGEGRLIPARAPLPWRRIAFWGVLVLGVLVLAWMAFGLYRDLNRARPNGD